MQVEIPSDTVKPGLRKVGLGATIGVPLTIIFTWAWKVSDLPDMPEEVSAAIGSIISLAVAYFVPESYSRDV